MTLLPDLTSLKPHLPPAQKQQLPLPAGLRFRLAGRGAGPAEAGPDPGPVPEGLEGRQGELGSCGREESGAPGRRRAGMAQYNAAAGAYTTGPV